MSVTLEKISYNLVDSEYVESTDSPAELKGLESPTVDFEDLLERIDGGNVSYEVARTPMGRQLEVVVFNRDRAAEALVVKPATSYSSAYLNPGNFWEAALAAAANPGAAYVYMGSIYPTSRLLKEDRNYLARTGRYTKGDGTQSNPYTPLPSLEDEAATLDNLNLVPTHITADVEAGRKALGLMCAFRPNSIRYAYLNGIDGISPAANYVQAKVAEDIRSRIHRHGLGESEAHLTPDNIKLIKDRAQRIYGGLGRFAHLAPLPVLRHPIYTLDKLRYTQAFRGHSDLDSLADHAVFHDMSAAIRYQEAGLSLQFNRKSGIHDLGECRRFGILVMNAIPEKIRSEHRGLTLLLGQGELDSNTDNPAERTRVERYSFPDIAHKMAVYLGSLKGVLPSVQAESA